MWSKKTELSDEQMALWGFICLARIFSWIVEIHAEGTKQRLLISPGKLMRLEIDCMIRVPPNLLHDGKKVRQALVLR